MSQLPSANQPSPSADPNAVPVSEPGFEVKVHAFWARNRSFIFLLCGIVLVGIIAREGWQYFSALREKGIQEEYAKVADQPEKLGAFADANSGHALAGVAYLQIADKKFEAADYKGASTAYTKAASSLKNAALLGRAKLGGAVSQLKGGDAAGGEAALKALSADQSLAKSVRAEATYHLASLANEAGKTDEVRKLAEEVTKIDMTSTWAQRATLLLSSLETPAKTPDASGITFKADGK